MNCCEMLGNGQAVAAAVGFNVLAPPVITSVGAGTQTVIVANLPVVGARVFYYGTIVGQQTNGQRGARYNFWTDASRNAIGSGILTNGVVGPNGYTDVATAPWNTVAVPAGWGFAEANLVGNQVQILFNAAAGQTVQWSVVVQRLLLGGATP